VADERRREAQSWQSQRRRGGAEMKSTHGRRGRRWYSCWACVGCCKDVVMKREMGEGCLLLEFTENRVENKRKMMN